MSRELLRAILKGDVGKIQFLTNSGVNVYETTPVENWSYLHKALLVPTNQPSVTGVAYLLKIGLDPNEKDCYGNTPLHYAARLKNVELINKLLEAGANVDAENLDGITPLRESMRSNPVSREVVEIFLNHGADVKRKNINGSSISEYARTISHGANAWLFDLMEKY